MTLRREQDVETTAVGAADNTLDEAALLESGAQAEGAHVRLRLVPELASVAAIDANPAWRAHHDEVAAQVPQASLEDLRWADGCAFGTPTRYGSPAAQLKQFIDTTGGLWQEGVMADKPATTFTSSINAHGGAESTILALNNVFYHWGSLIIGPGYTDSVVYGGGGNPYGTSHATGMPPTAPSEATLAAARYQGRRLARITARIAG